MNVRENFETITKEIAETCKQVGRNADEVKLIAVTKYVTDARVEEALEAGITDFAEIVRKTMLKERVNILIRLGI